MVEKVKPILLLGILLVQVTLPHHSLCYSTVESSIMTTTPATPEACKTDYSFRYGVIWPSAVNKTISYPPCVNQAEEFAYRECFNGNWASEPECAQVQFETPPECPDGYSEIDDICYKFTSKSMWPPTCDFPDVLPFYTYINSISKKISEPIWMPVVRDMTNGYGFLQWVEASSLYKSVFNDSFYYEGEIRGKDCLVYKKGGFIKAVYCFEKYPAVCAYRKLTKRERKLCEENCWQSTYSPRNKCFCLKTGEENYPEAEFLQPYQNSVYSLITSETCSIGLKRNITGRYFWTSSKLNINYTYWSESATFNSGYIYGASSTTGWLMTEEKQACTLIEKEKPMSKLTIDLIYNPFEKCLILAISNASLVEHFDNSPAIFCFTDTDSSSLVFRYTDFANDNTQTFQPFGNGPGNYWCEVFQSVDMTVIQTQKELVREGTFFEFVVFFEVRNLSSGNPLSTTTMTLLRSLIVDKFNYRYNYKPRIMKIVDVFENASTIWVNVHFSSSISLSLSKLETQKQALQGEISRALGNTKNLYLLNIYSTDYCFSDITYYPANNYLKWTQSSVGDEVNPDKFCFTVNGRLVTRKCTGDFINGASWSDFDKCKVLDSSPLTAKFLPYYKETMTASAETVNTILSKNDIFLAKSIDVFLMSKILNKTYDSSSDINIDNFIDTINSIHNIDKCIIVNSQVTARTTDNLLTLIGGVVEKYQSSVYRVKENFAVIKYPAENISGVMIQKVDNVSKVTKLEGNWTVDKIARQSNLVSAIWLSPELRAMLSQDTKIAFTIFRNDSFFGESVSTTNVVNMVFGVTISGYSPYTYTKAPVKLLLKIPNGDKMKRTCSFWSYQLYWQAGFWFKDGVYNLTSDYQLCDFYHTSNYAIVASYNEFVESPVTSNLAQLLDTEYIASDRVGMLVNISEQYDQFVPMDIFLVGKVLEAVNDNQEINLEALTHTISNLHFTNRTVLSQSQEQKQATDNILCYIDAIIMNSNYTFEFSYETHNFAVFISDARKFDFTGLAVQEENGTRKVVTLRGNVTLETILSFENLDSAVVISSELSRQMIEDSRVIITIFFTDSLFNADDVNHNSISTIFGVLFPQIGNFSGPISIFHNISETDHHMECSHWNYQQSNGSLSYWYKNDDGKNASNLIQCDFWHTTHFALLLLDKDKYYADAQILEWVTYVNSTISFIGLFGIITTAVLFKKWRKNIGNQILFNFTMAIMLQIVAFFCVSFINQDSLFYCTLLGALLHYSVVAQFCWMLVIAVLQFKRFVKVFATSPKCLLLKTCLCGWGIPVVPVILAWQLNNKDYYKSSVGFCYPSGYGLYLGVWLPLLIIITLNLCIFIYIMYNVIQRNIEPSTAPKNDTKYQWRLFVLLFFMLGMTWTFGFMAEADSGIVFVYLFCIMATLQGFVLFLYFIVLNSNTRYMYMHAFKTYCRKDH